MDPQHTEPPDHPWLGPPIDARPLFAPEHTALIATLRALAPADWAREAVPGWGVRDVAVHVLGDCYGRLARHRDGHREGPGFAPGEDLAAYIHRINQEWVDAHTRVSPAALTDTLELVGAQVARLFEGTDPAAPSIGVSWAGVDPAPMWLDTAREFTEYWTHRQQIRHATGQGTDPDPRPLSVVLDTFLRALPHTLRETTAPVGTQVQVHVDGPAGGTWTATATTAEGNWSLAEPPLARPAALVHLDPETAWRLCVRGIEPADALSRAHTDGDLRLAEAACQIVSIVR
ncbi:MULTISPECIES: maleylpyruvate isomerase family mycothiol-dependent enzyme [unclassified Streptomyces]|uniref:maleylpyruvate isomerase family mycothiol-dependent enzyme n=1 Tax=unclassified Streptomyces TaxID=2593676 RepID=UPI002366B160|nr:MULTISPECIES: maleylpyruvate isomerase family mycothiol-dependent enzyme [unclassified Streptomyces]MDF3149712.1 maleylpyruvate isomerase family mycothiol-dependent enzyme [Streptomyces sp. T21Q-yed]WDF38263.1 maleylpyruvate isomerase family mycothiol-dependent enzyme [Streptomyces sp. T12]